MSKEIVARCKGYWDLARTAYSRELNKMYLLNAVDAGDLWKALKAKFPSFQVLPDSNHVAYVKDNILASLYTTAKSAELVFTSEDDRELITNINVILENIWDVENVGDFQFDAGENAALLNLGITQVGWDAKKPHGNDVKKGNITLKDVDPMKFRRDPYVKDFQQGVWCGYYEDLPKYSFTSDSRYKEAFEEFKDAGGTGINSSEPMTIAEAGTAAGEQGYYRLYYYWVKDDDGKINEYHIINNDKVLYSKEDIRPRKFPFALLYCNKPKGLIGVSQPAKVFANNVAYNMLTSVALTAEYKNQRPPKFVDQRSGLNIRAFSKHGDEADRTFIVNGDATKAVHYHEFPTVSNSLPSFLDRIQKDMQDITGVDGRYTGRDTGSIITTGGTEEMLNRVTMIDTPKILMYEKYTKHLTELILMNLCEFAPKRAYLIKDKTDADKYTTVEVDFPKVKMDMLRNYAVQISSELPKNKQRVQAFANMMMEKQMQYQESNQQIDLITPEEWLLFQDIPYKEQMLQRMGMQKRTNAIEEAAQVIYEYGNMVDAGIPEEEALMQSAQGLLNRRAGQPTPLEENTVETPQESLTPTDLI